MAAEIRVEGEPTLDSAVVQEIVFLLALDHFESTGYTRADAVAAYTQAVAEKSRVLDNFVNVALILLSSDSLKIELDIKVV